MYEETKTFELKDKTKEELQFTFEMILSVDLMLSYETKSVFNQIVISFYDDKIVKELQKDNIIKIAQVGDKFHITVRGKLSQSQSAVLWTKFARDVNVPLEITEPEPLTAPPKLEIRKEINEVKEKLEKTLERKIEEPEPLTEPPKLEIKEPEPLTEPPKFELREDIDEFKKEIKAAAIKKSIGEPEIKPLPRNEIVEYLLKTNAEKGFRVTKVEIWNFVENYKKKFNRYLTKKDIESVGIGYIQMLNEKMGMPLTEADIAKLETPMKKSEVRLPEPAKKEIFTKIETPDRIQEEKIESIQKKTVSERIGQIQKGKALVTETLQVAAESTKLKEVSLSKKQDGIIIIPKTEGRRKCPNCEETNPNMIHESIDKTVIISHFPRIFGKRYKCGACGVIWREE